MFQFSAERLRLVVAEGTKPVFRKFKPEPEVKANSPKMGPKTAAEAGVSLETRASSSAYARSRRVSAGRGRKLPQQQVAAHREEKQGKGAPLPDAGPDGEAL